ncbi:MAG: hypothetical protein EZS28_029518 [Streblomastix strix]|uniref:Uncharacterized protein n=1 Tax=Streblomastix strix TaxID=222440 RepID=A0A5J4UYX6_9EUKA|nr:MAG: hypothetical protein EZS28_029518 [Streblomastix strix]
MKERIIQNNPVKENPTRLASASVEKQMEKPRDYVRRIAQIFEQECIDKITKYSVPTMIMRFTVPAIIHNVYFERKLSISQEDGDAELKITKIPLLFHKQEVNVIQQTLGTATQDIGENSPNGDFAFSAESGTVWMYDQNWYNSGDIVSDQVTPASDATPLVDGGTGVAGTSNEYSRGDHKHPLQVSDVLPSKDTAVVTVGQASSYARSDHQHPILTVDTIPNSDSTDGSYGTVDSYARNDHSHPINVQTNTSIVPVVNGVGNNGTSVYYSRHDHIHPQQLTYDGNVTAIKFIKTGGTINDILLADGTTKQQYYASKLYHVVDQSQYIKLCKFIALNTSTDNSIEFKVATRRGFGQIQFKQHWSNSTGISNYQNKFIPSLASGLNSAWIIYFETDLDRYGELWCLIDSYSYNTVIYQTDISAFQGNITEILTTDAQPALPTGIDAQNPLGFTIVKAGQETQANRGLQISADGNTLSFNGQVIVGGSVKLFVRQYNLMGYKKSWYGWWILY